jgi:hypothetical protein
MCARRFAPRILRAISVINQRTEADCHDVAADIGFAVHVLWVAAVLFAVFWLIGAALGRGESAGRHRFYRW